MSPKRVHNLKHTHARTNARTHAHTHTYTQTNTHTHTRTHTHARTPYPHTRTQTHTHTHTHTQHTRTHARTHARTHTHQTHVVVYSACLSGRSYLPKLQRSVVVTSRATQIIPQAHKRSCVTHNYPKENVNRKFGEEKEKEFKWTRKIELNGPGRYSGRNVWQKAKCFPIL